MYDEIEFEIEEETPIEFDLEDDVYLVEPKVEKLEVIPSKEQQEFKPVQGTYYNDVVVEKIPDEYVIPKLSKKTITKNGTYKARDDDLDGYDEVEVETSGVDINDYFNTTYTGNVSGNWVLNKFIIKTPNIMISDNVTSLEKFCANYIYAPKIICNSNIKDMLRMYYYNKSSNIDTSGLNTSAVTMMARMFEGCDKLTSLNLSNFDTSNVTNMIYMFAFCSSLINLNLSSFNTSKVTDMSYMFYNCQKISNLDLSSFNTSNVTNMANLFDSCFNLTSLNLSSFNTSKVTDMKCMFKYNKLVNLDLSSFNTSNVTNMAEMFYGCSKLTSLDIRNFDFTKVIRYNYMFDSLPTDCLIIVKDVSAKEWITSKFTTLTNVKTVAELEKI